MTQTEAVLERLHQGTLTQLQAYAEIGSTRLAARVEELRKQGHTIVTHTINRNGKSFAEYQLVRKKMAYEQQQGSGVLFTVKEKKSDKAPDWSGSFTCDQAYKPGDVIKLSAWTKRSAYGDLISIRVNNFVPGQSARQGREVSHQDDDSVPF